MKRVKAACILQTLVFSQKPDLGYTPEQAEQLNQAEFSHYKATLARTNTRHQILSAETQADGSILVHIRKQYNDTADVSEYFV